MIRTTVSCFSVVVAISCLCAAISLKAETFRLAHMTADAEVETSRAVQYLSRCVEIYKDEEANSAECEDKLLTCMGIDKPDKLK